MRRFARLGAAFVSTTLAVTGLAVSAAPPVQAVTYDPVNAQSAASWLDSELGSDDLMSGPLGGADIGLSIDTAFALQAVGGHGATVTDVADAIQGGGTSYLEYEYSFDGDDYAGQAANATAKAMAFMQALSPARTTIGTINLQTRLEALTTASGRIEDVSTRNGVPDGQNYANTLGQAFAARALAAAGSTEADEARTFLLQQQCSAGYFRLSFSSSDTTCDSGDASNIDATALAVIQMSAITSPPAAITTAIADAKAWLASVQNCDGSFGAGADGRNANSTGLTATALGDSVGARQAAIWLTNRQARASDAPLASDVGAVALNDADYAAGRTSGISSTARDRWRRASAQAATGLAYFSTEATPLIRMSAVTGYRKAGTRVAFRVTGAEAGTVVCLGSSRAIASPSGATVVATLPVGTAKRLIRARDGYGNTAGSYVNVLGAKTLLLTKSKYRKKRSTLVTATIYGLAPYERASIAYRGVLKRAGSANSAGQFRATFSVLRKLGKRTIAGYGQFGDIRKGYTKIKVVR